MELKLRSASGNGKMQVSRRHPETIKMPPPKEGTPGRQDTKKHQDTINFAYKQKKRRKILLTRKKILIST